ncbi:hypothetical protein [Streptomyces fagopyri]|uniref:hypothetical protein n=1 Tax=Streptomyces fagopyri TaxID=2662397 RepID=UPI003827B345
MRGIARTSADTVHDHHTDHHLGQRLLLDRHDTMSGLIGRARAPNRAPGTSTARS